MEVLVSMGSSVAYAYSLFSIIKRIPHHFSPFLLFIILKQTSHFDYNLYVVDPGFGGDHFFETSAALICFVLLGRLMENIAKGKTSQALVRLMDLKPKTATLVKDFGSSSQLEEEISSDLVQANDILKVLMICFFFGVLL